MLSDAEDALVPGNIYLNTCLCTSPILKINPILTNYLHYIQVALMVKKLLANAGDIRDTGSIPGSEIPWRRAWKPTPVFFFFFSFFFFESKRA